MGPLLGVPLLLVEGDDDYRIWSQVPRHHITNFAVIPTNGDEIFKYQRALETILTSLREPQARPLGYALLDGDKGIPQPSSSNPQTFVRFIRLNCHEAENLYLTSEVLQLLETEWKTASLKISEASGKYGEKAPILARAPEWDIRGEDIKEVIGEVARILDPKSLLWSQRVGVAIGRTRPDGELADFLGRDVIHALWE